MIASYKAYEVPTSRPVIKTDPDLLEIPKLTDLPDATNYKSIHERSIILGSDLAENRTQLIELIGATKQREYSEQIIFEAEEKRAKEVKDAIEEINKQEIEKNKPWYKKVFQ